MNTHLRILSFLLLSSVIGAQTPPEKKADNPPAAKEGANQSITELGTACREIEEAKKSRKHDEMKDYFPLSVFDPKLKVNRVSFVRKHAGNGKGEFLDVQLELTNTTTTTNNYSIYVLALNETDSVEDDKRGLVPYPKWRNFDPLKVDFVIHFSNLMPVNMDHKEIMGEKDYNTKKACVEERQLRGEKVKMYEPSLWQYVLFLSKNSQKALPFTIYGEQGPPPDKVIVHNLKPGTEEEEKKQMNYTSEKHNYTMYNSRYQTTIFSHHYTQYRPDFYTYNKVVVMIFDPTRQANQLVYRSFFDLGKLKMTY
ncbi:MAG: hypothetical protein K8R21_01545 [Leptospira sp.]|nr:hypothetical protein [Leptospira sp.]